MVAGYAAKQMAELGLKPGELPIIWAESAIPCERPPLSKGFLAGKDSEESIRINPDNFYRERGIDLRLKTEVKRVAPAQRSIHLPGGAELGFEKLILATGSTVRTLAIPGAALDGIHYLRTVEDS